MVDIHVKGPGKRRIIHRVRADLSTGRFIDAEEMELPPTLKSKYDGHVHTTVSDGWRTPEELAGEVRQKGLTVVVTDHFSLYGAVLSMDHLRDLKRLAGDEKGSEIIAGMEVTTKIRRYTGIRGLGKIHLLGVAVDVTDEGMKSWIASRRSEIAQAFFIRDSLRRAGFKLRRSDTSFEEELSKHQSPYRCLASELFSDLGNLDLIGQVFRIDDLGKESFGNLKERKRFRAERKLSRKLWTVFGGPRPWYRAPDLLTATGNFHHAGGKAFATHIASGNRRLQRASLDDLKDLVGKLKRQGVDGIDAYCPDHSLEFADRLAEATLSVGLLVSGGSDAHFKTQDLGRFKR
ncbi:MAG: PHP domain-containing protein [Candidatus Altiarchaeota archaeon]